jgi:Ca2+-binding RTX toxin-like protein
VNADLSIGISTGFGTDALAGIEGLVTYGQADDMLTGDDEDNVLVGFDGDDTLVGGDGEDIAAFFRRCVFWCDSGAAVDADLAAGTGSGQGSDTLLEIENLRGTASTDTLVGDAGPNRLEGVGGNDSLFGGAGDDSLDGGTGVDTGDGGPQATADFCISIEIATDCEPTS